MSAPPTRSVLAPAQPIHAEGSRMGRALQRLIRRHRIIVVCGAATVGKSFVLQQLALNARTLDREVHCLRWQSVARSVARWTLRPRASAPAFADLGPTGISMGTWLRRAIENWDIEWPEHSNLLLIEAALLGGQFTELAAPHPDIAEQLLSDRRCKFLLVQPSQPVFHTMELARRWRRRRPLHHLDTAPANHGPYSAAWFELLRQGLRAGILDLPLDGQLDFDPHTHTLVYRHILRNRGFEELKVEHFARLTHSVHALSTDIHEILPTGEELDHLAWGQAQR